MPDIVDITIEIENYRMELADYLRRHTFMFMLMILLPIPGLFMFIRWNRKKRALDQKRIEIGKMLNELSTTIPLNDYLALKKRLSSARQY